MFDHAAGEPERPRPNLPPSEELPGSGASDLERVSYALVKLAAWTRRGGLDDLADLIDAAADHADLQLTGSRPG